ncbi:TPA: hypothetical protein OKV43_000097 [Escherichia coli]|nr:hypothetical protein [Escherichia coli]
MLSENAKAERKAAAIKAISEISSLIDNVCCLIDEDKMTPLNTGYTLQSIGKVLDSVGHLINVSVTADAQNKDYDDAW